MKATWVKKKSIFSRLWFIKGVLFHLFFQERENAKFTAATGQESAQKKEKKENRFRATQNNPVGENKRFPFGKR